MDIALAYMDDSTDVVSDCLDIIAVHFIPVWFTGKSVLTVCLESANQNSILSAAIIYLSLDEYASDEIDLAIGIPIMYTLIAIAMDGIGGFLACQLNWVNCKLPDDPNYIESDDEEADDTITFAHVLYRYKQWRRNRNDMVLLSNEDLDYGGIRLRNKNATTTVEITHCDETDKLDDQAQQAYTLSL
eukprot:CAMPEP_0202728984 /NCGR_PEP_ID=MMETSP1385-20130828/185898_1 /ASSEMBLY_ACC=CAM_ASM_000861 /TAXON_ID=933848 /ORGANISM="Elphidium margaritaceum" /LENGTH=186 /DNA_ID=CAMNT_0049395237 /DNA_START=673 /DNA_END=1234 /DNA_ORIENTATION=-